MTFLFRCVVENERIFLMMFFTEKICYEEFMLLECEKLSLIILSILRFEPNLGYFLLKQISA